MCWRAGIMHSPFAHALDIRQGRTHFFWRFKCLRKSLPTKIVQPKTACERMVFLPLQQGFLWRHGQQIIGDLNGTIDGVQDIQVGDQAR